ncbi:hypothetical protein PCE1_003581 [Barthelona sp. PCE]
MKFDVSMFRAVTTEMWRILVAVEMGMKNHEITPVEIIERIAALKRGSAHHAIRECLKMKLVKHENKVYDGYALTWRGYDYLALNALVKQGHLVSVGSQIGVGKEADIYMGYNEADAPVVLKFERLGRISFRGVKNVRDYHGNRKHVGWMYLSRLATLKEFAYMTTLLDHDFPVPIPIACNRHCLVMSLAEGYPLQQITDCGDPELLYTRLMGIISRLALHGLVHGDFNEFNIMVTDDLRVTVIDFPQMIPLTHHKAREYFERDCNELHKFFLRRFHYEGPGVPSFPESLAVSLDEDVEKGISVEELNELNTYISALENMDGNPNTIDTLREERFDEDEAEETEEEQEEEPEPKQKRRRGERRYDEVMKRVRRQEENKKKRAVVVKRSKKGRSKRKQQKHFEW